jgi:hypothetical protein
MKPLKVKRTNTEQQIERDNRADYGKFIKTTLKERRKQKNINKK